MSYVSKSIGFPNGDPRNATGKFGGESFRKEAAGALADLNVPFRKRFGKDIPVGEGMRGIDRQNYYYDRYINRLPGWTVAAYPGTSNHGWGLAADFGSPINNSNSDMHKWLQANAGGYGWFWAGADFGEPWHWEYDGRNVDDERAARYNTDTPIKEEGFLMALSDADQLHLLALAKAIREGQLAPNKKWTLDQQALTAIEKLTEEISKLRADLKK